MSNPPLTPFGSALAGALGAVCSNALVYPLDTVKTRLQALPPSIIQSEISLPTTSANASSEKRTQRKSTLRNLQNLPIHLLRRAKKWQMLEMLLRILKTEGLSGAFKGFGANMINTFSMQFAYFFFHTLLRSAIIKRASKVSQSQGGLSTSTELLLGAAAGGLAQIFTIPVAVIATRQQLFIPTTTTEGKLSPSPSLLETAHEIISEGGPTALWTGLKPGLVLTVNPAITYGVFERVKSWILTRKGAPNGKLSVGEAFLIGVFSKTLATVVTYPYIFAKVRLQAKPAIPEAGETTQPTSSTYATIASQPPSENSTAIPTTDKPTPKPVTHPRPAKVRGGAINLLKTVYKERGIGGWYQGMSAQIVKAVLCQGILFVTKDQFEVWAWMLLSSFAKLRSSAKALNVK